MAITWTIVQTLYAPNDADIQAVAADPLGNQYVEWAEAETVAACWGDYRDRAAAYLAAHYAKIDASGDGISGGGAVGPISSESVGGVSKSYGSATVNGWVDQELGSTLYGRRFLRFKAMSGCGLSAMVV